MISCAAALALGLLSGNAGAVIVIGGYTFEDNAFIDTVISWPSNDPGKLYGGATSIADAVVGTDLDKFVNDVGKIEFGFTDNVVRNNPHAWDLVVFDIGEDGDGFSLALSMADINANVSVYYSDVSRTNAGLTPGGLGVTAILVDLADLGVADGATFTSLAMNGTSLELTAIGATNIARPEDGNGGNAVPEPTTVTLLGIGLLGLVAGRFRLQRNALPA